MVAPFANPPTMIAAFEQRYRREFRREHALLLDATGRVVVERIGDEDSVEFSKQEMERACMGSLSHNHPKGKPPSSADLSLAAEYALTLRAVGSTPDGESYEYTVHFPIPSAATGKLIAEQFDNEMEQAEKELSARDWSPWKWERESRHLAVTRLAQRHKFLYQRVQKGVRVSETKQHEHRRLDALTNVDRAMRSEALAPLHASLLATLSRYAEHTGVIELAKIEAIRRVADRLIQHAILGVAQKDGTLSPFTIQNGEVMPRSAYFKTLWALMRDAATKAVDEQADIMRRYMPDDLRRLFEVATISPFDTTVSEAEQTDNDPPLFEYDPLHRWQGDDGKQLSDRIWIVAGDMRRKLDQYLANAIATRKSVQQMALELERFLVNGNGSYEAMRLARTEVAMAHSRASSAAARLNPFVTTYSPFTAPQHLCCDNCDVEEARAPYPKADLRHLPPFHPECICGVRWNVIKNPAEVIAAMRGQVEQALSGATKSIVDFIGPLSKQFLDLLFRGRA